MAALVLPPSKGSLGEAPGMLVALPRGYGAQTHYRLDGAAEHPLVILLNGINDFSFRYDLLAPALIAAGKRVLRFDAYGRGWSGTPPGALFDLDMHRRQLEELLEFLGISDGRKILIAHSMGCITAVSYACAHAEKVERLVLMAPAGVMQPPFPGFAAAQKCLRCCTCLLKCLGGGDPPPGDFFQLEDTDVKRLSDWNLEWTRAHLKVNGSIAFATSAAYMPLTSMESHIRSMADCEYDVLLLRADQDPMVILREQDLSIYRTALGPRLSEKLIANTGHCFFLEKHDETLEAILAFTQNS